VSVTLYRFRAGDVVRHEKSREVWTLACDQQDSDVMPAGWPECWAKAADCVLVSYATDEARAEMLRHVARSRGDHGEASYRTNLARVQLHASTPKLCGDACALCLAELDAARADAERRVIDAAILENVAQAQSLDIHRFGDALGIHFDKMREGFLAERARAMCHEATYNFQAFALQNRREAVDRLLGIVGTAEHPAMSSFSHVIAATKDRRLVAVDIATGKIQDITAPNGTTMDSIVIDDAARPKENQ
jgi:hypothetical protein